MLRALPMLLAALVTTSGCGPSATEGGFESANSAARMYAIEESVRAGDRSAVHDLIESLDSDDPAVRFLAISSLERLTGETYGYRHYDSVIDRRDAINRQKLDSLIVARLMGHSDARMLERTYFREDTEAMVEAGAIFYFWVADYFAMLNGKFEGDL